MLSMVTGFFHRVEFPIGYPELITFIIVLAVVVFSCIAAFPLFLSRLLKVLIDYV